MNSVGVHSVVIAERGRWAVYLDVSFWRGDPDQPLETVRRRIADFPSRRQAEVAAGFYTRGADRTAPFARLGM